MKSYLLKEYVAKKVCNAVPSSEALKVIASESGNRVIEVRALPLSFTCLPQRYLVVTLMCKESQLLRLDCALLLAKVLWRAHGSC